MRAAWQPALPEMPSPPPARAWRRLTPPEGYEQQWRRLVDAALELGLGPDELAATGLDPIVAARGWKPATVALYSKVARYGGVVLPTAPTPEPEPAFLDLRPLTAIRNEDPEHLRTVAWCALALGWPASVAQFRSLRRDQVRATARRHPALPHRTAGPGRAGRAAAPPARTARCGTRPARRPPGGTAAGSAAAA